MDAAPTNSAPALTRLFTDLSGAMITAEKVAYDTAIRPRRAEFAEDQKRLLKLRRIASIVAGACEVVTSSHFSQNLPELLELTSQVAGFPTAPTIELDTRDTANAEVWSSWTQKTYQHVLLLLADAAVFTTGGTPAESRRRRMTTAAQVSKIAAKQGEPFDGLQVTNTCGEQVFACHPDELAEIIKNKQQELGLHAFPTAAVMATILFHQQSTGATTEGTTMLLPTYVNAATTVTEQTQKVRDCLQNASKQLQDLCDADDDATRTKVVQALARSLPEAHINPHGDLLKTGPLSPALTLWIKQTLDATRHITELLDKTQVLAETMRTTKVTKSPVEDITDGFMRALDPIKDVVEFRAMIQRMQPSKSGGFSRTTREHLLYAPDNVLALFIPIANLIIEGKCSERMKLGIISPLVKDAKRYRPVTLL